jgi:hypothetical protein
MATIRNIGGKKIEKADTLREIADSENTARPGVSVKATVQQEMPEQIAEVMKKQNLRIKLDKIAAGRLIDQGISVAAKDGCISSPSGPSC